MHRIQADRQIVISRDVAVVRSEMAYFCIVHPNKTSQVQCIFFEIVRDGPLSRNAFLCQVASHPCTSQTCWVNEAQHADKSAWTELQLYPTCSPENPVPSVR